MKDEEEGSSVDHSDAPPTPRTTLLALVEAGACQLDSLARVKQWMVSAAAHKHSSGTVFGWLIGLGLIAEQERVVYIGGTKKSRQLLKEGTVTSAGLVCGCCGQLFNLSGFEGHCGSKLRRPAANIFVGEEAQLSIADCQNVAYRMETLESLPESLIEEKERRDLPAGRSCKLDESFIMEELEATRTCSIEGEVTGLDSIEMEETTTSSTSKCPCGMNFDPFETCDYSTLMLPPPKSELFNVNKDGLPVARRRRFDCYVEHSSDEEVSDLTSVSGTDDQAAHDLCCAVCHEGGDLLCCETCPSTSHMECVSLVDIPKDAWFCWRCLCSICGEPLRTESCEQCERRYHPGCCHDAVMAGEFFFCSTDCWNIFQQLSEMVNRVNPLGRTSELSWRLLRHGRCDEKLLAEAHRLLSSRFDPVVDCWTQLDYMDSMVFSRSHRLPRLDFSGFYTAVLEMRDEIVGVAEVRIHGRWLAEMPFIATKLGMDGRGMCRSLFSAVEEMLAALGVETMVLLAAADVEKMWRKSFEFQPLDRKLRARGSELGLVALNGAGFLQKNLGRESEEEEVMPARKRRRLSTRKDVIHAPATPPVTKPRNPRARTRRACAVH